MRGYNQKLKLLYLKEIFEEETDNEHSITMPKIIELLKQRGVEAERKSVYEDIRLLQEEYGLPIEHEEGKRNYRLAEHMLQLPELKLIIDSIASSKTLTEKQSRELIDKLKQLCSKHEREMLNSQIIVSGRAKAQNNEVHINIDKLNTAISAHRMIDFQYFYYDVDKEKKYSLGGCLYIVRPYAMIYTDNNYYLLALDLNQQQKNFRIDRMTMIRIRNTVLPIDHEQSSIDLSNYTRYTFSMYSGNLIPVTMRFDTTLVSMVLDRFGYDTLLIKDGDKHFKVIQPIAVSPQFYGWIFSLGNKAEIVSPLEVKKGMADMLEELLYHYTSDTQD